MKKYFIVNENTFSKKSEVLNPELIKLLDTLKIKKGNFYQINEFKITCR
jgi:hypothetical protein